ncbi:sensor histidine kinase [Photobacterium sp. TY1-4]|uniref:ATP-binding protein n=1 Tax=Photobacterium sp. TY1-4 TaxID=2899122 RepID=UPI0021C08603|nr:sensor histidine kinase [Photobacterium sp. TY1-4]UXI03090.1 sensor histidine kinase [Photobacterium sp. TY1-4]
MLFPLRFFTHQRCCRLAALLLLPASATAASVQENWQQFYHQAWQAAEMKVPQAALSTYPKALLHSDIRYPDFNHFSWPEIQRLWQVRTQCRPSATELSPALAAAQAFELALCRHQPLSESWFRSHAVRHPAGGSYAERYVEHFRARFADQPLPRDLAERLTLNHPRHPLYPVLKTLSEPGRDALLDGYRAYLDQNELWLSGESGWKSLPAARWQPLAQQFHLVISDGAQHCSFRYSNLCLSEPTRQTRAAQIALAVTVALLLLTLGYGGYQRHQQKKERRFILQLLTHELRTPITSLGLTVEMFRTKFDVLPPVAQQALWRLISDHQRLTQLTEASKDYLSTRASRPLQRQPADLQDWLAHIGEKHPVTVQCHPAQDPTLALELALPYYWLTLCVDNLIRNARQHGQGNITLDVSVSEQPRILCIIIGDQGDFPSGLQRFYQRIKQTIRPVQRLENMGIGLDIVARLMKQMGGRLLLRRHPTRCILELPL